MPDNIDLYFFVTIRDLARNESAPLATRVTAVQALRDYAAKGFVVCAEYLEVPEIAAFAKNIPDDGD